MSKHLLFLATISLMLFVLALAGQDRPRLATQLTGTIVTRVVDAIDDTDQRISTKKTNHFGLGRSPASVARTLDIEPVLPGGE